MIDRVSISPSALQSLKPLAKAADAAAKKSEGASFGEFLKDSINSVNDQQLQADQSVGDLLTGKNTGLHETMLSLEKADISMRLMVQIRNRAVESYREIMRMQV